MSDEIKVHAKNKKTKLIIAVSAVVIAVLTITAIVLVGAKSATARKVGEQLSLGEKYLSELNYEQAIAAYELAIEIDPKSADAYLGLAEVYEEMGEFDKAIEVLEEAKAVVGEEELERVEAKLKEIEEKKQEALKPVATVTPMPTAMPEPTPTLTPTATPELTATPVVEKNPFATAKVGEVVKYGRFLQDFMQIGLDSEEFTYDESHSKLFDTYADEIEWYVLNQKDSKILLLSKYVLDTKPYHEENTEVTWEKSSIREWLNSTFYNFAFSDEEKKYICKTKLANNDNEKYGTEGGQSTVDQVFLLSIEEAKEYFNFTYDSESLDGFEEYSESALDERLIGVVTDYAILNGASSYLIEEGSEECSTWWYLRSMGGNNKIPAIVEPWGYINAHGYPSFFVDTPNGVRPAIWVDVTVGVGDGYIERTRENNY